MRNRFCFIKWSACLWLTAFLAIAVEAQERKNVGVDQFARAVGQQGVQLLDVRTPEEYGQGHIKGAKLADWKDKAHFEAGIGSLDKNKEVYLYCRSGNRSGQAAEWLAEHGFKKIVHLDGGIKAWEAKGKTLERPQTKQ